MSLRDQAIADLETFLSVFEFGDTIEVDGVPMACVVESNGDTHAPEDGVVNQDSLLHTAVLNFETLPVVGQRLVIDDKQSDVVGVTVDQGMVELRLRWWAS